MKLLDKLGEPSRYLRQLERLYARVAETRRVFELQQDGVPLSDLVNDKGKLAKLLARAVRDGSFRSTPAPRYFARLDKDRELVRFSLFDVLVHAVAAEILDEAIATRLSPRLFSFRAGRSSWQAVRDLALFTRRHRRARPDPRTRGFYVLRADVRRFCESVPLADHAPLWPLLAEVLGEDLPLMRSLLRPTVLDADEQPASPIVGLPFGSPITNVILNLYLSSIDETLAAVPGGFYARFGDDLIFAHDDAAKTTWALDEVRGRIEKLGLTLSPHKVRSLYFNGAGRSSTSFAGSKAIAFLGCEVTFDGTIRLPRDKWRELLLDVRARIRRTHAISRDAGEAARLDVLCRVVNEALDPLSPLAQRYAPLLAQLVTDRHQLAELDHHVALALAETLSGMRGPRAFRRVSWSRLRASGLQSRIAQRNSGRAYLR
ncbi:MAG TPA: reverse transcriptase domain-containing protein [Kofleriaceae bacterium]|nr:reverse transcriptase domain-containing protein [Kofleriaceae bacterium]